MKKRIAALLLSVVLCLGLIGTAFAAEGDSIDAEVVDGGVRITGTLTKGETYLMVTILDADGAQLKQFNIFPKDVDTFLEKGGLTVKVPGLEPGMGVTVNIPNPKGGDPISAVVEPEAEKFAVTIEEGEGTTLTVKNGEADVASGDEVEAGSELTVTVAALEGYENAKVTVDGAALEGSTVTVEKAVTIASSADKAEVPVVKEPHSITVETVKHGKMTADKEGETVTLTASDIEKGYYLSRVTVEGASGPVATVSAGENTRTFVMPDEDVTVTPVFSRQSSGGGGGGGGWGGGSSISYTVKVNPTEHGKVTARPTSAVKDQKVTLTVEPAQGYALDEITAKDANGRELTLTKADDATYTFLMPALNVTVDAEFTATGEEPAETSKFSDVADKNYTFYADIMWAAEKGYMNGYSDGTFRPNNTTTRQALWMVLARIDGANPSDMSAARAWAMASKISDGTNPGAAMSRQQMVTMLYRYAQLKGYKTTGGMSISAYPDAANVASYARDAMSWAIGNGIVNGTSDGKLNPTGTASRAHFAAFLHRFAGIAGL